MANSTNKQLGQIKKVKLTPGQKYTKPIVQAAESLIPKTPLDAATWVVPYGKVARGTAGIIGKGAKYVAKLYR